MNSIDIIGNCLWIIGIALIITAFGWEIWNTRVYPARSGYSLIGVTAYMGGFYFCAGVLISTDLLWVKVLFSILSATFGLIGIIEYRSITNKPL